MIVHDTHKLMPIIDNGGSTRDAQIHYYYIYSTSWYWSWQLFPPSQQQRLCGQPFSFSLTCPVIPIWACEFTFTWIILLAGTFFGALFAFPMGDMVGGNWGIAASCMIFDTKWAMFVVGLVIARIGVVCYRVVTMCSSSESEVFDVTLRTMCILSFMIL